VHWNHSGAAGFAKAAARRVATGRNGDGRTQLILPVSNCGISASVRAGV